MARPTLKAQAATDMAQQFDTDLPWVASVTYNGVSGVPADICSPESGKPVAAVDALADELIIFVRKADVTTYAKGTAVVIDGENWEVFRRIGGGYLNHELLLRKSGRPVPRRSL